MRTLISSLLLASVSITSAYAAVKPPVTTTIAQPPIVEMQTSVGTVTIQLNWDKAPISSKNFLDYVNSGFYNDTFFHRIYSVYDQTDKTKLLTRVVQGGGFDASTIKQKTTQPAIVNEASNGLHNSVGTIAMARTSEPNSATSQFFFNVTNNSSSFDAIAADTTTGSVGSSGYAVFGEVLSGMDIVTKIGNYGTIKTAYSEGVPFSSVTDCGFNFCLKKVIIEAVYTSNVVDTINSVTRVKVNGSGTITTSPANSWTLLIVKSRGEVTTISPNCTSKNKSCTLTQPFDAPVSLIAIPSKGYTFTEWSGDCAGTTTPLVLVTTTKNDTNTTPQNNNCTATFTKIGA